MLKNKRGQMGIAIMASIFALVFGLMVVNFLMPEVTDARNNMNCADASAIHDGTKLFCLALDSTVIYWIVIVFSITIGGITSKLSL